MQELQKILEVACEDYNRHENKDYLSKRITSEGMYYGRGEEAYLQTLEFETPIKLQEQIHKMWETEQELWALEKILVVAAFKLRDSKAFGNDVIKDKVYNF